MALASEEEISLSAKQFVRYKASKEVLSDSQVVHRYYLIDGSGADFLVATGEERHGKTAFSVDAFALSLDPPQPYDTLSQEAVLNWITSLVATGNSDPHPHGESGHDTATTTNKHRCGKNGVGASSTTSLREDGAKMDVVMQAQGVGGVPLCTEVQTMQGVAMNETEPGGTAAAAAASAAAGGDAARPSSAIGQQQLGDGPLSPRVMQSGTEGTYFKMASVASPSGRRVYQTKAVNPGNSAAVAARKAHQVFTLRQRALTEASKRETVKQHTLSWLRSAMSSDEEAVLSQWLSTLKELWVDAKKEELQEVPIRQIHQTKSLKDLMKLQQSSPDAMSSADVSSSGPAVELGDVTRVMTWSYNDPHLHQHGVRLAIECLREVSALCLPCQAMQEGEMVDTVKLFCRHPHPAVSSLAQQVIGRWQRRILSAVSVLGSDVYNQDPGFELEKILHTSELSSADILQC
ncbi:hypothetical protein CEUSTIGMA_g10872.t1 [Chlamydomonas eustigma]|uniref:Uncharacterized protein n=1 Tax=Chlamydomonas eustigma TaxID=1157962 RepID=A0A250XK49_9CHLO|nr:hypothetical protein CEUSTIGMA_g10872.t1 [Chlamydomonas eustigma]|eukprot:GAX83447.1 hypothetical protein CEUSTIGMA_g10872.t1 [Chlamydomonas eustigma]